MPLRSHSEVGGVEHEAPPPGHAHLQPPGTEPSSYTTSMHNADKAITASSLVSQVQPPVGQNDTGARDLNTKTGAGAQPPAARHSSSTFLTQDPSESSSSISSLSLGEFNPTSGPQSLKRASVSEASGSSHSQQAMQPAPSTGKNSERSSSSPTPSSTSTPSYKESTPLQGDPQEIVPSLEGLEQAQPVAAVVEEIAEEQSLLSDEASQTASKQERGSNELEVSSLSSSSLVGEPCEEGSAVPSVTSPPHQHGDGDHPQPSLTILDILSPQESDVQDQKPNPENLELEPSTAPNAATPLEEVLTDHHSTVNGARLEQQDPLLVKEEELVDEGSNDNDSFWDMEPGATAASPSLPLFDSGTPVGGEMDQDKPPSKDKPPQDDQLNLHASERMVLSGLLNQGANGQSGSQTDSDSSADENGFAGDGHHGEDNNGLPLTASAEYKQLISSFSRSVGGDGGEGAESGQSSLLSETSAVRQIEEEVAGGKNEASGTGKEVSTGWVHQVT